MSMPKRIKELIDLQVDPKVKKDLEESWNQFQELMEPVGHVAKQEADAKKKTKEKAKSKAKAVKQARKKNRSK